MGPFALDESNMLTAVVDLAERDQLEVTILGGQVNLVTHLDHFLGAQAVGNQVLDSDDGHIEFLCHLHQLGQASHGAVRIDNLDKGSGRVEACNPHQVNGCLGVAGTFQHALVNGAQGVDVAGTAKILWLAVGIGQRSDGHGAVVHRHARCTAVKQVNSHCKRGAQH